MISGSKVTPSPSNEGKFEIKNEIFKTMQCKMLNHSKTAGRAHIAPPPPEKKIWTPLGRGLTSKQNVSLPIKA